MAKLKKLFSLLLCGAMCASLVFAAACNAESGNDPEDDTYIDNTETPDDGTGDGETETHDDGTGSGEEETPDDETGSGETETPDDGTGDGEEETVYTVTESEWDAALSYEKILNCTVSLYTTDGTIGYINTGYTSLAVSDGIITGKVYYHVDKFTTTEGVENVYSLGDCYEYQTDTYCIYATYRSETYSEVDEGMEYFIKYTTAGYYNRLFSVPDSQEPFFMFLDEDVKEIYFNYSNFEYDETTHEYVYEVSGVGSVRVIFEDAYVTYVKLISENEGIYWEWKYSNYGTTNIEEYFTDEIMTGIIEYYEASIIDYNKVILNIYEINIFVGDNATLIASIKNGEDIIFTVADESVVSIVTLGSTAILRGISEGTTTITATAGENSATCTVTVTAADTSDE